jgi:hypothetical protein
VLDRLAAVIHRPPGEQEMHLFAGVFFSLLGETMRAALLSSLLAFSACDQLKKREPLQRTEKAGDREADPEENATPVEKPRMPAAGVGEAAVLNSVAVKIESVEIGIVKIKGFRASESKDQNLIVRVKTTNRSKERKVDYRCWQDGFLSKCTLRDDKGNRYKSVHFGIGDAIDGQVRGGESIYPRKSIEDVLIFEPPVTAATKLTLELEASCVGGDGTYRFEIPAASWK